jgi:hypothetical protein
MATVYRFEAYDIHTDEIKQSQRWGTREGIARIGGWPVEGSGVEVDDGALVRHGLTERNFNPTPRTGFQQTVEMTPRAF